MEESDTPNETDKLSIDKKEYLMGEDIKVTARGQRNASSGKCRYWHFFVLILIF